MTKYEYMMRFEGPPATQVVSRPDVLSGMPVVEGTRVPAATIAAYLRAGRSDDYIREDYPSLPWDGIEAVRNWARAHA